ncbi:5-oxoprolinase subunit PxpB [Vibrio sp.]|nr:5-oxoprolinase subunit PxpB [Vibrio sp.]
MELCDFGNASLKQRGFWVNERAYTIELYNAPAHSIQKALWVLSDQLRHDSNQHKASLLDVVVGMNNITVNVSASFVEFLPPFLNDMLRCLPTDGEENAPSRIIDIPVSYGGEFGPDLQRVAKHAGLSMSQVIAQHTYPIYPVFFLGFQPGFAYLNGLPSELHTPRLDTPRAIIPAGAVGIGGAQTGIYPNASPGGWNLIGHTDITLFDSQQDQPSLLQPGDSVRFVAKEVLI